MDHAFSEAMGGMPGDVPVDTLIAYERPHRALAANLAARGARGHG